MYSSGSQKWKNINLHSSCEMEAHRISIFLYFYISENIEIQCALFLLSIFWTPRYLEHLEILTPKFLYILNLWHNCFRLLLRHQQGPESSQQSPGPGYKLNASLHFCNYLSAWLRIWLSLIYWDIKNIVKQIWTDSFQFYFHIHLYHLQSWSFGHLSIWPKSLSGLHWSQLFNIGQTF